MAGLCPTALPGLAAGPLPLGCPCRPALLARPAPHPVEPFPACLLSPSSLFFRVWLWGSPLRETGLGPAVLVQLTGQAHALKRLLPLPSLALDLVLPVKCIWEQDSWGFSPNTQGRVTGLSEPLSPGNREQWLQPHCFLRWGLGGLWASGRQRRSRGCQPGATESVACRPWSVGQLEVFWRGHLHRRKPQSAPGVRVQLREVRPGELRSSSGSTPPRAAAVPHRGLGQILNFIRSTWDYPACALCRAFGLILFQKFIIVVSLFGLLVFAAAQHVPLWKTPQLSHLTLDGYRGGSQREVQILPRRCSCTSGLTPALCSLGCVPRSGATGPRGWCTFVFRHVAWAPFYRLWD